MPERDETDGVGQIIGPGRKFVEHIWPLIGNELPSEVHERILGPLDRLGDPEERAEESIRRARRIVDVHEGLLAAHYHRDNIERIEVELVRRLREVYPEGSAPEGGGVSAVMPVVAHEYMAYLFAARRTLDYLAKAVSALFGRWVHSIKDLAGDLEHGMPKDLAERASAISKTAVERFPDLLTADGERSDRDQAAHFKPIAPAFLSVVFFIGGRVGIELHDSRGRLLPPMNTLDPERMSRDEPILTQAIDARLADLHEFCGDLIDLAIEAEEWRLAQEDKQT